ncbi:hypothetical protein B0O80DRAFT_428350 [Mortierella sp. GBAus27b]|nr:hypothetical protein B0O80DRAFT_428350 [Mortierella sp. GBAus27b]
MNGVLSQAFRSGTSTRITTIPTRLDTKRGERVVRWSDILQCYGDSVRDTVLFLADGDLENLIPLRIAYHPDVVLMVVAEDHLQEESSSTNATSSTTNGLGDPRSNPSSCHQLADTSSNQALVVRPRDHHSQTQTQNPHMDDQRDRQLLEMDPIRTLQEEMEGVQQSVRDQHEVSQQSIQRQLEVVQQLVQDQDEESRQRMQQQLEGVQQSVQNQHEESQQRMQQQIDEGVQQLVLTHEESQQRIQRQLGGVQHLVQYQHEELQQRMQRHLEEVQQMDKDEREWKWEQRQQEMMDETQRRIDLVLLKIGQLETAQQESEESTMSGTPSQSFKSETSARITTIPTRLDPKRGERVVRWSDIQQCYGDTTKFVMNGQDVVLFLTDDDLENLMPLRIPYHPDVVLVVVTEDQLQEESRPTGAASMSDGQLPETDPIRAMQEEIRQLRQEMQQQVEGVQQLVHDQHQRSRQADPIGETMTLPKEEGQVEETLQGMQGKNGTALGWQQRLQEKVDRLERRIDEMMRIQRLDTSQQMLGEVDQSIEGSLLQQLRLKMEDVQRKTSQLEEQLQDVRGSRQQPAQLPQIPNDWQEALKSVASVISEHIR